MRERYMEKRHIFAPFRNVKDLCLAMVFPVGGTFMITLLGSMTLKRTLLLLSGHQRTTLVELVRDNGPETKGI